MMDKDMIVFILCFTVIVFIVSTPFVALVAWGSKIECEKKYAEFNPEWHFIGGCIIEYNTLKIPADSLRIGDT